MGPPSSNASSLPFHHPGIAHLVCGLVHCVEHGWEEVLQVDLQRRDHYRIHCQGLCWEYFRMDRCLRCQLEEPLVHLHCLKHHLVQVALEVAGCG